MKLPHVWDVKSHYALEAVADAARSACEARDTSEARERLLAVRTAAMAAYSTINEAESEARRAALANLARAFA